jgi:hypothetical protein
MTSSAAKFEPIGRALRFDVHWPDLDEDLSVRGMLGLG